MQNVKERRGRIKGRLFVIFGAVAIACLLLTFTMTKVAGESEDLLAPRPQLMNITLSVNGKEQTVACGEESVGALLQRLNGELKGRYETTLSADTAITAGMVIPVDYVVEQEETYTVEIPFEITYVDDPTLPKGEQKLLADGKIGIVKRKTQVIYRNSQEISRELLEETTVQPACDQVVAVGTGEQVGQERKMPLIGDGIIVTAEGEVLYFTHAEKFVATAYTKTDPGCDDDTSTGTMVRVGVVAVDPKLIPYGTRMFIITDDGEYIYGIATAEDCGGSIQGNRLDLYFDTDPECWEFGIRDATAYFLGHVGVGYYK